MIYIYIYAEFSVSNFRNGCDFVIHKTDRRTEGGTDKQTDRQVDNIHRCGYTNGQIDRQTDRQKDITQSTRLVILMNITYTWKGLPCLLLPAAYIYIQSINTEYTRLPNFHSCRVYKDVLRSFCQIFCSMWKILLYSLAEFSFCFLSLSPLSAFPLSPPSHPLSFVSPNLIMMCFKYAWHIPTASLSLCSSVTLWPPHDVMGAVGCLGCGTMDQQQQKSRINSIDFTC